MKAVACLVVLVAMLGTIWADVGWGSVDPAIKAIWHNEATKLTRELCEETEQEKMIPCFENLPSCRYLLYYVYPFTEQTYQLIVKYMDDCSQETASNLNVSAMPSSHAEWGEEQINGLQMFYYLNLVEDNITKMFRCLQEKFNNLDAFKDCINLKIDA